MLVKDVLKLCADYLNLKELKDYLDGNVLINNDIEEDLNNLLLAVNMVNSNLAANYFELVKTIDFIEPVSEFEYSDLSENGVIDIKSVLNRSGKSLGFQCLPEKCKLDQKESVVVTFSYFPPKVTSDSNITHYSKLNDVTFAMGVVAEYLFIKGAIDDAYMWDKRFKSSIFGLMRPRKNIIMPAREWL